MKTNYIYNGNCVDVLRTIEDQSIQCCVTSPPYYGLRDYGTGTWIGGDPKCPHRRLSKFSDRITTGHKQPEPIGNVGDAIYKTICPLCGAVREDKQIGLEESPEEYVSRLVDVFREVRRVLKDDGTLWLNIGDSYAGSGNGRNPDGTPNVKSGSINSASKGTTEGFIFKRGDGNAKPKDMIGIPWMLAFALRDDGWYLRQDIIWAKPNPMPESVRDRCTKSHEYIFLLSKSPKYYYSNEAIKEPTKTNDNIVRDRDATKLNNTPGRTKMKGLKTNRYKKRNKRDVWMVSTKPFKEAHFATFPEDLIVPCILAGCPAGGVVLDPFMGAGTTGLVATKLGRKYVGIELNQEYIDIANKRINNAQLSFVGIV